MTWDLTSVQLQQNGATVGAGMSLANLVRTVVMTYNVYTADGVIDPTVPAHVYTEPNVSDVSQAAIAKLAGDHRNQLNAIARAQLQVGTVQDLATIKALMVSPSPRPSAVLVAAVRSFVTDWTQTDDTIAANLNAAMVANPVASAPMVDPNWDPATLQSQLGAPGSPDLKAISASPYGPAITDAIQSRNTTVIRNLTGLLFAGGTISQTSYTNVIAYLTPVVDPTWTAQVSQAALLYGRQALAADVYAVRVLN